MANNFVNTPMRTTGILGRQMTKIVDLGLTVGTNAVRDGRLGPATLYFVEGSASIDAGATKNYIKVYDDISDAFVPGTTAPDLVIPVKLTASGGAAPTSNSVGTQAMTISTGLKFDNGISMVACQEAGDTVTTVPGSDMDVYFTTDV